jgi:Jacalin-like lectin domain/Helix-hairpin-helix domain
MHSRLGPWGGAGGTAFESATIPTGARLSAIHIFADSYVHALQLAYVTSDGNVVELPRAGGAGGAQHTFALEDGERITAVSGLADWFIDAIRFHTTLRTSELFGGVGTHQRFWGELPADTELIGVFGRHGWYIDALGLMLRQEKSPPALAAPRVARPSELVRVEGIGPKIAELLIANNVLDLADLAAMSVERLSELLAAGGSRFSIADPTTWPEQAALGAAGDWEGLATLQKALSGGRRGS